MESVINDYISREIVQDPALLPLSNDTSLLEGGILDSLSLLRLARRPFGGRCSTMPLCATDDREEPVPRSRWQAWP